MAFNFVDTFCNINASAQSPWDTNSNITYSSAFTRFVAPAGCLSGGAKATSGQLAKNLPAARNHYIIFASVGVASTPGGNSRLLFLNDTGTGQCGLVVSAAGALQFYRNNTPIGVATAPATVPINSTGPVLGIEIELIVSTTVGIANLWVNGTQLLNQTGLNTQNTGNATANQFQFGDGSFTYYTDYVRVWDSQGTTQNAPVGLDRQPITKVPNGVGTNSNMTPVGLTPGWRCVSVVPPNVADYVSANGTAVIDDYAMPTAGLTQAPTMVAVSSYMEKDDANTRTYSNGVLSGGVTGLGPNTFTASASFAWVQNCVPLDPATGVAWTASGADNAHVLHEEVT